MSGEPQTRYGPLIPLMPQRPGEIASSALRFLLRQPGTVLALGAIAGLWITLANLVALGTAYPRVQDQVSTVEALTADPQAADQAVLAEAFLRLVSDAMGMLVLVWLLSLPVAALVNAMLIHTLGRDVYAHRTTVGQAAAGVRVMAGRILGQAVVVVAVLAVCGLPMVVALSMADSHPLAALGMTVLLVPICLGAALIVMPRLIMAPACLVLEHSTVTGSFVRSRHLVRGHSLRVIGIAVAAFFITRLVGSAVALPFTLFAGPDPLSTQAVFLSSLGRIAGTAVALPLLSAAMTLLYVDLRVRSEGLGPAPENGGDSLV